MSIVIALEAQIQGPNSWLSLQGEDVTAALRRSNADHGPGWLVAVAKELRGIRYVTCWSRGLLTPKLLYYIIRICFCT